MPVAHFLSFSNLERGSVKLGENDLLGYELIDIPPALFTNTTRERLPAKSVIR